MDRQITAIKDRVVLPLEKLLEKVNELIGQILSKPNMKNTDETYLLYRTIKPLYHFIFCNLLNFGQFALDTIFHQHTMQ